MTALQRWSAENDLAAGMPLEAVRQQAGLPAAELVPALLDGTGLVVADGYVRPPGAGLPPRVDEAVRSLEQRLAAEPFRAPEADELRDLGLGARELAAAVRLGRLTRIADGVVLGAHALHRAAAVLTDLPQPFTVAEAKRSWNTTRRVAVPLLEQLDAQRFTRRDGDGTRRVISAQP